MHFSIQILVHMNNWMFWAIIKIRSSWAALMHQVFGNSDLVFTILLNTVFVPYNDFQFSSVQSLSGIQLCDPMDYSTPGLPVHHQLPEFTQTHVPWGGDVIQPSHPLSSPPPPAVNLSQHQGLFQWPWHKWVTSHYPRPTPSTATSFLSSIWKKS